MTVVIASSQASRAISCYPATTSAPAGGQCWFTSPARAALANHEIMGVRSDQNAPDRVTPRVVRGHLHSTPQTRKVRVRRAARRRRLVPGGEGARKPSPLVGEGGRGADG